MSQQRLTGTISLSRLVHVMMKKQGKSGEVLGMFIPLEANKLEQVTFESKDGPVTEVQMTINVIVKSETDDKGQDGFVSKSVSSKIYKEATDEEKEAFKQISPILGNLKDWNRGGVSAPPSGDAAGGEVVDEHDDLPF